MAVFKLKSGQFVQVDDEDLERVKTKKWHIGSDGYVKHSYRKNGKVNSLYLHHFILGTTIRIDHWDTNKLNNTKLNLRPATTSQNADNSRLFKQPKTSRFKGVYWESAHQKWHAQIGSPREYIGLFVNEIEAAKAYDSAAKTRWGAFARLNFP